MALNGEYITWLEAHIALQQDILKGLTADDRKYKEGHIALLKGKLKEARKELREFRKRK